PDPPGGGGRLPARVAGGLRGGGPGRLRRGGVERAVALVDDDDARPVATRLLVLVVGVGDQDHQVTARHQVGGGAVEADLAAPGGAGDGVGGQPVAVGDVEHVDPFVLEDVGGGHQGGVDGHRPLVVQVGVRHRRAVDLRLHHRAAHGRISSPVASLHPQAEIVDQTGRAETGGERYDDLAGDPVD